MAVRLAGGAAAEVRFLREALNAFPADAPQGSYRRIDEGAGSLRTYVVAERYMVRVRPTQPFVSEGGGWSFDADGVIGSRR